MQRLKRVFSIDTETCERCAGKVKIIACIEDPAVIERILAHLNGKASSTEPAMLPEDRAPSQARLFERSSSALLLPLRKRRNELELAGKGLGDGGSVEVDFGG